MHDAFSALFFLGLPAACSVVGYRFARAGHRRWARYSIGTATVFVAGFILAAVGFAQNPAFVSIGGLLQRLTVIVGLTWMTALALHLIRADRQPPPGSDTPGSSTSVLPPHDFELFGDGDAIVPGVRALVTAGHTPGHTSYVITSQTGRRLIVFGDAFRSSTQVTHPDWMSITDSDPVGVQAARHRLLETTVRSRYPRIRVQFRCSALRAGK